MIGRNGSLLVVALIAIAVAIGMMLATRHAMESATGDTRISIADLELSWSGRGFEGLIANLAPTSRAALADAHSIDSLFALAYSVAFATLLAWLSALDFPMPLPRQFIWVGLCAGAFDQVENLCLQRCLRAPCLDALATDMSCLGTLDGPLHIAAIAASIKFALAGIAFAAIVYAALGAVVSAVASRSR